MLFVITQESTMSVPVPDDATVCVTSVRTEQQLWGCSKDGIYEITVNYTPHAQRGERTEIRLGYYREREKALAVLCQLSEARCKDRGHFVMPL